MPLQATSGAASYDAFGGGVAAVPQYIEDVFSTYLYTGDDDSTRAINNGVNLSGKGGLIWFKRRNNHPTFGAIDHTLFDTARGLSRYISTNNTDAQTGNLGNILSATTTGFKFETDSQFYPAFLNGDGGLFASWTFRKQPKFFDVVTWTGNGANPRQISHNLGSVPGCIIIKSTTRAENWTVYHTSLGNTGRMALNTTAAAVTGTGIWASTTPTSTNFTVSADNLVNFSGDGYVAYLFAHDAGGFGLTGTDNVISCGSYTGTGAIGNTITVGYEPQWVMIKASSGTSAASQDWYIYDVMRGMPVGDAINDNRLMANLSSAEASYPEIGPTATGFVCEATGARLNESGTTYIYIAIRRGPMAVPTTGTSVFQPYSGDDSVSQNVGYPTDMYFDNNRAGDGGNTLTGSRLIGNTKTLSTASTAAETTIYGPSGSFASNTNFAPTMIGSGSVWYSFRRAPGFFDVVCYTGGSSDTQVYNHNLAVPPELIIIKRRNATSTIGWWVGANFSSTDLSQLRLNQTNAATTPTYSASSIFRALPTASTFTVGNYEDVGASGGTYVSYLFASCPGVSKVFSFTGNGTTQTINCGFTGGARFVLIKRTDSTGDWYVYDTARGMTVLTDPYLLLNSTAAETATLGSVITSTGGFTVNAAILAAINTNAASYVFLAIA